MWIDTLKTAAETDDLEMSMMQENYEDEFSSGLRSPANAATSKNMSENKLLQASKDLDEERRRIDE